MSRKGNCLDNAIIENFFGILKSELFYLKKYNSINQLKKEIKEYILYYNNDRIKSNLNKMSPIQYRGSLLSKLIINLSKLWVQSKLKVFFYSV
jgi:putative transposase